MFPVPSYRRWVPPTSFPLLQNPLTCLQRIRQWFYNRNKLDIKSKSTPAAPPVKRKVVRLTQAQAYSSQHCAKGSAFRTELHDDWKLYVAGDEATVTKYKDLFTRRKRGVPFVTFQQAVIDKRLVDATEQELAALDAFIETRYEHDVELREHPWQALKVDDSQLEIDLEKQYLEE
jgi:hypothetical protein